MYSSNNWRRCFLKNNVHKKCGTTPKTPFHLSYAGDTRRFFECLCENMKSPTFGYELQYQCSEHEYQRLLKIVEIVDQFQTCLSQKTMTGAEEFSSYKPEKCYSFTPHNILYGPDSTNAEIYNLQIAILTMRLHPHHH